MDIQPIKPFDPFETDEGWRQIAGTWLSEDQYYACLRPRNASGFDGEDILVIRDDNFGAGLLYAALPEQEITGMISGKDLADPMDAVLTIDTGRVLMLRDGLMRYEVIPGFEKVQPRPSSIWGISSIDGKIWVTGSGGYIFRREGETDWRLSTESILSGSLNGSVDTIILNSIDGVDGSFVSVGSREYLAAAMHKSKSADWSPVSLPRGWLTGVSHMNGEFYISAGQGDVWVGTPEAGYRHALKRHYDIDFDAIACWNGQAYVAGSEGPIWRIVDGLLEEVRISGPNYLHTNRFEVRSRDCILEAENGFAVLQDDGSWRRISVPWGPGTFPA